MNTSIEPAAKHLEGLGAMAHKMFDERVALLVKGIFEAQMNAAQESEHRNDLAPHADPESDKADLRCARCAYEQQARDLSRKLRSLVAAHDTLLGVELEAEDVAHAD